MNSSVHWEFVPLAPGLGEHFILLGPILAFSLLLGFLNWLKSK